jgi:hypothetical protein
VEILFLVLAVLLVVMFALCVREIGVGGTVVVVLVSLGLAAVAFLITLGLSQ